MFYQQIIKITCHFLAMLYHLLILKSDLKMQNQSNEALGDYLFFKDPGQEETILLLRRLSIQKEIKLLHLNDALLSSSDASPCSVPEIINRQMKMIT